MGSQYPARTRPRPSSPAPNQSSGLRITLVPHALAPVAELPVLEVVSAVHILADLTLGLGKVVHDYLR